MVPGGIIFFVNTHALLVRAHLGGNVGNPGAGVADVIINQERSSIMYCKPRGMHTVPGLLFIQTLLPGLNYV